jgi:hypothetical protein
MKFHEEVQCFSQGIFKGFVSIFIYYLGDEIEGMLCPDTPLM